MMQGAVKDIVAAIGRTPIVRLNALANHVEADIYCKLEFLNPGGSSKDRPALQIILDAEADGTLCARRDAEVQETRWRRFRNYPSGPR